MSLNRDGWETVSLTDVLDFREGPGIMARDFRECGVPLLRLSGLKRGAKLLDGCNYLDEEMVTSRWNHFRVMVGDVLLSTSASLGEVAVVDESAVGALPYTGIIRFRPKSGHIIPDFVQFALTAPTFKRQIEEMGVGSVMRHFGPTHLAKMTVTLPPISAQRSIATVLAALDDKIAVNDRIGITALTLAENIFGSLVRGVESGPQTFATLSSVFGGGTPRTSEPSYWDGEIAWATPSDVTALHAPYLFRTQRTITESGLANCASQLYPAGSIFMTSRATIGAFAIPQLPTAVNQGFIVVIPRTPEMRWWLFHEMRSRVSEMLSLANGSTFLELSRTNFKQMPVRLAADEIVRQFHDMVDPLHRKAAVTERETSTLRELRDTLLPKLMSGEIQVRDAERIVEGAT